jgi:hypothetical protein
LSLDFLRTNFPLEFQQALPGGKVPAIVHENLTVEEEAIIRIDHGKDEDRVPLDKWGEFLAVQQLIRAFGTVGEGKITQAKIAEKMGWFHEPPSKNAGQPNRSYVQVLCNLAMLPQYVQDEFQKYWTDNTKSPVRTSHISKLKEAFDAEFTRYPAGDGPIFVELWNGIMNPGPKPAVTQKSLSPASAKTMAQAISSPILRTVLLSATGQNETKMVELDAQILNAVTDSETLASIKSYLGETDFNQLVANAKEFVPTDNVGVDTPAGILVEA